MTKIHIDKDLISRIQCDAHRTKFGWLHGSISSHNEGKHVHVKDHFHSQDCMATLAAMNDQEEEEEEEEMIHPFPIIAGSGTGHRTNFGSDGILGWYLLSVTTTSPSPSTRVVSQRQLQEEEEMKVKQTFRQMHIHLMKRLIRNGFFAPTATTSATTTTATTTYAHLSHIQNLRKMFGLLIGLMVRGSSINEQETDQMVQVFKNQIQVYSVYVTDAYMQSLYEFAFKSTISDDNANINNNNNNAVFDEELTLRRDLSLIVQTGQMSQFFRGQCKTNMGNDLLNSARLINEDSYEDALRTFGTNFFNIKRVEEFCGHAMTKNDEMLAQYNVLYHENRDLSLKLAILNEAIQSLPTNAQHQQPNASSSTGSGGTTE